MINLIERMLSDALYDRLDKNNRRTALDDFESRLFSIFTENRCNNDTFDKILDMIASIGEGLEKITGIYFDDRDGDKIIHSVLDAILAYQVEQDGYSDRVSDSDWEWILDVKETDVFRAIYSDGRRRGRDTGYSRGGSRRDSHYDRYDDRRSGGIPYGNTQPNRGGYTLDTRPSNNNQHRYQDNYRDNYQSSRIRTQPRPVDNRRAFRESDGFSRLVENSNVQQGTQAKHEAPTRRSEDDRRRRDGYGAVVEENVSYERVESPRSIPRQHQPLPEAKYTEEHVKAQELFEDSVRGSSGSTRVSDNFSFDDTAKGPVDERFRNIPPRDRQGYDHTTEHPYEEFWEDDRLWQASTKTKWELTGFGTDRFPQLYNIFKYVSYHVMDKYGNVTQEFKAVNDDNRYINHSLVKEPDNFTSSFGRRPPKISEIIKDTREPDFDEPVDDKSTLELKSAIDLNQSDLDNIGAAKVNENLSIAAITARSEIDTKAGRKSAISMHVLLDPVEGSTVAETEKIKELYTETTLLALANKLKDLEGVINKPLFTRINNKIGDAVLAEANSSFGLNISSLNFAKRWGDVMKMFADNPKKYDPQWLDSFSRRLNSMIPTFLGVVDLVDLDGKIDPVFEHIVTEDNVRRVIPFVNFYALVSIDTTLDKLSIGKQLELSSPVIVRPDHDYYSAEILHAVLDRVVSGPGAPETQVMLSTKCGSLIEVRRQGYNSTNLVLTLHK